MNRTKNIRKIIGIIVITISITLMLIVMLYKATYSSLETNLKSTIVTSDIQKADVLKKQISVFFSTMEGFVTSISQMTDDLEKDKVKLVILLSDLTHELNATGMGIVTDKGKGVVGLDVDFDRYSGMKKALAGKNSLTVVDNGPNGESKCLLFAVPLYDDVKGKKYVFYATIAREYIYKVFRSSTEYNEQYVMLINKNREVMLPMTNLQKQKEFSDIMDNPANYKLEEKFNSFEKKVKEQRGAIDQFIFNGDSYYVDVVYVDDSDMFLVSLVDTDEATSYIQYATNMAGIIFAIVVGLFAIAIILTTILQFRNQSNMFRLAYNDKLTGIYNWEYMQIKVYELLKEDRKLILVLFDIKGLKYINDIYGFASGDKILLDIANFIKENKFTEDNFYGYSKLEDDAFALVIEGEIDERFVVMVKAFMNELQGKISDLCEVNFAVGIAPIKRNDDGNYHRVIDDAYSAMESNSKQTGITIGVYDQEFKEELIKSKKLEGDLPYALKNKEIKVYLQPKYDTATEKIVGAEALVRWQHHELGFISPGQFIPLFESNGMISKIDRYVLDQVCANFKEWKAKKLNLYPISVNLSRAEVNDKNLVNVVKSIRDKYDIGSDLVEIEITESSVANNDEQLFELMEQLRTNGFKLSMDDFGTGYSSLSQLMKMPIDYLKLDKSFIDNCINDDPENKTHKFIANVVRIAKDINCKVVAEGVETKEQRDTLLEAGCDIIQGFYYAKPMPVSEYEKLLKE